MILPRMCTWDGASVYTAITCKSLVISPLNVNAHAAGWKTLSECFNIKFASPHLKHTIIVTTGGWFNKPQNTYIVYLIMPQV